MEARMKLVDHVTVGIHFKSVHLYVFNNADFVMNCITFEMNGGKA